MTKTLFVGIDGEQAVDSATTQKQIQAIRALECVLVDQEQQLNWNLLDDPKEHRTIFQAILADRKIRIDQGRFMADRPNFAVVTAVDSRAVRLEYYEGHDALELSFDLRARELHHQDLPRFMGSDPNAYDPAKFLQEALGLPQELTKSLLKKIQESGGTMS